MTPNILYIVAHDLGDWLGCYGKSWIKTPHIDRLAAEGARFDQFVACAPICMPSRVGLYAGKMPHMAGAYGQMPYSEGTVCLPRYLKEAGYRAVSVGGFNILNSLEWAGFEEQVNPGGACWSEAAAGWIGREGRRGERPFLLCIAPNDVHRPFEQEHDAAVVEDIPLPPGYPEHEQSRPDLAALAKIIGDFDAKVGRVVEALKREGLLDETLVVVTTEHGPAIPRHKHTLYNGGLDTALVMRWPGAIPVGARYGELLSNMDLLPTLLELVGAEAAEGILGKSFAGLFRGEKVEREAVFSEHTWGRRSGKCYYVPSRSVRTKKYHYIRHYFEGPAYVDSAWIARLREDRGFVERTFNKPLRREELYAYREDAGEERNLAEDLRYRKVLEEMRASLDAFLEETDDPIRQGPIPHPQGLGDEPQWLAGDDGVYRLAEYEPFLEIEEYPIR